MRFLLLLGIGFYQRFLSPLKGYRCAHAVRYGGASCSNAVKIIIANESPSQWLRLSRARFEACGVAATDLRKMDSCSPHSHRADNCDAPGCDAPGCDSPGGGCGDNFNRCEAMSLLPIGLGATRRRKNGDVYLMPGWAALVLFVGIVAGGFFVTLHTHGDRVGTIAIKLVEGAEDASDGLVKGLLNLGEPEYGIEITTRNKTFTLKTNADTAEDWIYFTPRKSWRLYLSEITRFEVVERNFSENEVLERFDSPQQQSEGGRFEYKIETHWSIF